MQTVISHKLLLCKNLKEKNETLKKLIVNHSHLKIILARLHKLVDCVKEINVSLKYFNLMDIDIRQNVEHIGK